MQIAQNTKEAFKNEDKKIILDSISKPINDIVSEIELSFDYFETRFERSIDEIVLSGGELLHPEIQNLISEKLEKRINEDDICEKVVISNELKEKFKKELPLYFVALGLSLRVN